MSNWNTAIIEEFRANAGTVGGNFEGAPLLLLHTTGAKTGLERINPLMYLPFEDRLFVFASKGGAPTHPDWFHNVVANPEVTVEIGTETRQGKALALAADERDRIFDEQVGRYPQFGEYQRDLDRTIPVVELLLNG